MAPASRCRSRGRRWSSHGSAAPRSSPERRSWAAWSRLRRRDRHHRHRRPTTVSSTTRWTTWSKCRHHRRHPMEGSRSHPMEGSRSLPSRAVGSAASWWEVRRAGRCPECRSMRSVPESSPRPRRPTRRAGTRFMACRPGRTWSPSSHSGRTTRGSRRLRPPGGRSRSPTVQTPGSISPWCFIRSLSIAARAASHMVHRRRADASSETNARGAKQPEGATEGQPWRDRFHRLWSGIAVRRAA